MKRIEIYYFSGTGNSYAVARDLAVKLKAKIINIATMIDKENINSHADVLGFVFPVYDFKHPLLIEKIINRFNDLGSKYVFAICTYGINPSKSMNIFDKIIKSNGGELSCGFTIKMPHNGIGSGLFTGKEYQKMFINCRTRLEEIKGYIVAEKKGKLETSNLIISLIISGLIFKVIFLILKLLKQVIFKGWKSLAFIYNEKCNGCGICKKICPVDNIEIIDNKPSWMTPGNCTSCFACINWCPQEAIQIGHTDLGLIKYHHPEVKISDLLKNR
jgi:ferredoxin/flavodoxin